MHPVIYIFFYNIVPLFIIIAAGIFLGSRFEMDVNTLTKISFYITVPAFVFTKLYSIDINNDYMLIFVFAILQLVILVIVANIASVFLGHSKSLRRAFQNSVAFYNSGNVGIPLITLVFSSGIYSISNANPWLDLALSVQVTILVVQNASVYTFGYLSASSAQGTFKNALKQVIRLPIVYTVPLALILKLVPIDLREMFFWPALEISSNALISISLLTLGIQLTFTKFKLRNHDVWVAVLLRLIGSPVLTLLLVKLMGISGVVARVLFISGSVPTALNTCLIAVENNNEPNFATQVVLVTTVLCIITLLPVIWLSTVIFPL